MRDEFETLRVEYGELLDAAARGVNVSNLSDRLENVILKLERKSAIIARLQRTGDSYTTQRMFYHDTSTWTYYFTLWFVSPASLVAATSAPSASSPCPICT